MVDNNVTEQGSGMMVAEQFIDMLVTILGSDTMQTFQRHFNDEFNDTIRDIERKLSSVQYNSNTNVVLPLPFSLRDENVSTLIEQTVYTGKVALTGDKLKIEPDVFKNMFEYSVKRTIQIVSELMERTIYKHVQMIVIVGEFSRSPMFQHIIRSSLDNKGLTSIFPKDSRLAALKGAVIFGNSQRQPKSSIAKYSFAFKSSVYQKAEEIFSQHTIRESTPSKIDPMDLKTFNINTEDGFCLTKAEQSDYILHVRVHTPADVDRLPGPGKTRIDIEMLNQSGWKEREFLCESFVDKKVFKVHVKVKEMKAVDSAILKHQSSIEIATEMGNQAMPSETLHELINYLEKIVFGNTSFSQNSAVQTLLILLGMKNELAIERSRIMRYLKSLNSYDKPVLTCVAIGSEAYREALAILVINDVSESDIQVLVGDEFSREEQERLRKEMQRSLDENTEMHLPEDLSESVHTKAQITFTQDEWDTCLNPDHGPATWKCINCEDFYCTPCKTAHSRGKKSRRHFMLHISDKVREKDVLKDVFCRIHDTKELDVFCISDEEVICSVCAVTGKHAQHMTESLDKHVDRIRFNVGEALTNADKCFPQYEDTIKDLSLKLSFATKTSTENCNLIDIEFEKASQKLKQNAESLKFSEIERTRSIQQSIRKDIKAVRKHMTESRSKILECRSFLENCRDKELIQNANIHIDQLQTVTPPQYEPNVSATLLTSLEIQRKLGDFT